MKRQIITIDPDKCDGCGQCVDACAEGAIQIVDGKAKLVRDDYCDGLGACLGECPQDAIHMIEREAAAFDPEAVATHLQPPPPPQPQATESGELNVPCGCPGLAAFSFDAPTAPKSDPPSGPAPDPESALRQWPIQLALVPTHAPCWNDADLLLAADCTAFALGGFHARLLQGKRVLIACPKLDEICGYVPKLTEILAGNTIRSLTVARMEVPCCGGLVRLAQQALAAAGRDIPFHTVTISIQGHTEPPTPTGKEPS